MHGWRLHPEKFCLPFKTMKNTKIADPDLKMNSFYDEDDISQQKLRCHSESKIWRCSSPVPWLAIRNQMVSFVPVPIFVLNVVQSNV